MHCCLLAAFPDRKPKDADMSDLCFRLSWSLLGCPFAGCPSRTSKVRCPEIRRASSKTQERESKELMRSADISPRRCGQQCKEVSVPHISVLLSSRSRGQSLAACQFLLFLLDLFCKGLVKWLGCLVLSPRFLIMARQPLSTVLS